VSNTHPATGLAKSPVARRPGERRNLAPMRSDDVRSRRGSVWLPRGPTVQRKLGPEPESSRLGQNSLLPRLRAPRMLWIETRHRRRGRGRRHRRHWGGPPGNAARRGAPSAWERRRPAGTGSPGVSPGGMGRPTPVLVTPPSPRNTAPSRDTAPRCHEPPGALRPGVLVGNRRGQATRCAYHHALVQSQRCPCLAARSAGAALHRGAV